MTDAEDYLAGSSRSAGSFGLERMRALCDELGRAAAPLRLDPRGRHERQVLGDDDDGGAARGARRRERGLHLAARLALERADPDRRARRSAPGRSPPPSSAVAAAAEAVDRRARRRGEAVTQFEAAIAAAFVAFAEAGVEVAVIEAGLGGRLDATNVIPSRRRC